MTEAEIAVVLDAVREIDRRTFDAGIQKHLTEIESAAGPEYEMSAWELRTGTDPRPILFATTRTRNASAAERRAEIAKVVVGLMESIAQEGLRNLIQSGTLQ